MSFDSSEYDEIKDSLFDLFDKIPSKFNYRELTTQGAAHFALISIEFGIEILKESGANDLTKDKIREELIEYVTQFITKNWYIDDWVN
jgi:hypothetical protein